MRRFFLCYPSVSDSAAAANRQNRENQRLKPSYACYFLFYILKKSGGNHAHRAALVGIVVEDTASIPKMNEILSVYSAYIVGRMGLPYRERGYRSSASFSTHRTMISSLSGKIGMLPGISSKTVYSKIFNDEEEK